MIHSDEIENFLQSRKIDAKLFATIENRNFSRFSIKLGPTGKISSLESILREFGLLTKAVSTPVLFTDFPSGLVNIDIMTGELDPLMHESAMLAAHEEITKYRVPLILGRDYTGFIQSIDIVELPHLLVGGSTGSGKSVFLHSIINTILQIQHSNIKLLLIDPKKVEFGIYNKSKKLVGPIISDQKDMTPTLSYLIDTMNKRYETLSAAKVRNISEYNGRVNMPYLLVIIDEVQDVLGKHNSENESMICAIAQKGRAAGIHLILATQHPSKEILSPKIKANFPARVGFKTANSIYSRVLLDQCGAESLLGKGDGIFKLDSTFIRFKAPFINISVPEKKGFWSMFS